MAGAATQSQEDAGGGGLSALSPDVLLFALPFAALIDVLDFVLEIGTLVSIVLGLPILLWMVWKTGGAEEARQQVEDVRERYRPEARARRRAAKSAALRQARRRVFRRGALIYLAELIPILNLIPFWLIAVISVIRKT